MRASVRSRPRGPLNRRPGVVVVLVLGLALVAGGCGSQSRSAEDQVPALSARLTGIDDAISAHHYGIARARLEALVRETTAARDAGTLDTGSSERVLAAAAQLIGGLPRPVATPTPTPTPTSRPPARKPVKHRAPAPEHHDKGPGHHKKH